MTLAAAHATAGAPRAYPDMPLDRHYSMRNRDPAIMEDFSAAMILDSAPLAFSYPRPCGAPDCGLGARLEFSDSAHATSLGGVAKLSESVRSAGALVGSTELGAASEGGKGPVAFYVDARIYAEAGGASDSYDREDFDSQAGSVTGSASYRSYARYRGNVSWETAFGRFTAARDAIHWGPGLFENLTFQQDAVPFDQFRFTTRLGPLALTSLYGSLVIGETEGFSEENLKERNLYAHRYELSLGRHVLAAVSEQLILYNQRHAFLFVPVFPLFIAKGTLHEESNNGNIAADLTVRWPGVGLFYGEFLLDDLESPSSLFTREYAQNKWALMLGFHLARNSRYGTIGWIQEWSRVEPWVYTHFRPGTSQAANLGYPLGNQAGPNSMTWMNKAYIRTGFEWYLGLGLETAWKGRGPGSRMDDLAPQDPLQKKAFLDGADPRFAVEPEIAWNRSIFEFSAGGRIGNRGGFWARTGVSY